MHYHNGLDDNLGNTAIFNIIILHNNIEMEKLQVKELSPRAISKLRNGHKIRIMKGTGLDIYIDPSKYNQITKTFAKNKGSTLQLSGEEINANKEVEGGSLFKSMKKGLNKLGKALAPVGKEIKKMTAPLKPLGDQLRDVGEEYGIPIAKKVATEAVKQGAKYAPQALASLAIASGNPELAPVALTLGKPLSKEAEKALIKKIDKIPEKRKKMPRNPPVMRIPPRLPQAIMTPEPSYDSEVSLEGQGLYAGKGLYAGRGLYGGALPLSYSNGMVTGKLKRQNVALQSQPQFENNIMRMQMGKPPIYF
jgi:hypothetical protein